MSVRFGLGTYRCREIAAAVSAAICHAVDLIDTAPIYANGRAQTALNRSLADHPELKISTKVGHMTTATARDARVARVITEEEAGRRYSIGCAYIDYQIERNRQELGRDVLDTFFLHNPELAASDQRALTTALIAAFERCEQAMDNGSIRSYGVATWDGLESAFTVTDLQRAARLAAGTADNGLAVVQMPISLVRLGSIAKALDRTGPLIAAADAGLEVWASAPLSGGELAEIVTPELAILIHDGLTPVQAALSVVASIPGVSRILLSASSTDHWAEATTRVVSLTDTTLREVCDVLGT